MDDQVSIPRLMFIGGLVRSPEEGQRAIAHGKVYVQKWNLTIAEVTLPRWVLRGVTITCGDKSMTVAENGRGVRREVGRERLA